MMPAIGGEGQRAADRVARSDPPIVIPSGNPTTATTRAMAAARNDRRRRRSSAAISSDAIGRHGVRPRMPSTVGATRASAGASKNGIAATPAMPAMIEPGKI